MNTSSLLVAVIVTTMLVSCGSTSSTVTSSSTMTGSYSAVDAKDAEALACATYAVSVQEPRGTVQLIDVLEAQRQVVAGMNYRLKLSILRRGIPETATTVVWSKLDGSKEVMSFEKQRVASSE
jgi:hypothetical protein